MTVSQHLTNATGQIISLKPTDYICYTCYKSTALSLYLYNPQMAVMKGYKPALRIGLASAMMKAQTISS